jgi:hypothetical protein
MFSNRRQTVLVAVLAVAILGFLGLKVVGGGGGGGSSSGSPISPSALTPGGHSHKPSASTTTTAPQTFDVFATRDPFEPAIQAPPPTTAPPATVAPTPTTVAPTPTTGAPTINPNPGQTVSMLSVFVGADHVTRARMQVDATVYTLQSGDSFAKSFKVVSLDAKSGCGQLLFGDSPFQLCEGQQAVK